MLPISPQLQCIIAWAMTGLWATLGGMLTKYSLPAYSGGGGSWCAQCAWSDGGQLHSLALLLLLLLLGSDSWGGRRSPYLPLLRSDWE